MFVFPRLQLLRLNVSNGNVKENRSFPCYITSLYNLQFLKHCYVSSDISLESNMASAILDYYNFSLLQLCDVNIIYNWKYMYFLREHLSFSSSVRKSIAHNSV